MNQQKKGFKPPKKQDPIPWYLIAGALLSAVIGILIFVYLAKTGV